MRNSKQIIIMIKDFVVDGKKVTPRKGKFISQGAHASLKAILDQMSSYNNAYGNEIKELNMSKDSALYDWITGSFTKICCIVDTEAELLSIYEKAKGKNLICSLITDNGKTEFNGNPTITCCAIGPVWDDELVGITDHLSLF